MRSRHSVQRYSRSLLVSALLLSGGGDDPVEPQSAKPQAEHHETPAQQWLDLRSHEDPAEFSIARQKYADPADSDAVKVREVLNAAGRCFEEIPRMLANRALQLQDMLDDLGGRASAVALTRDLHKVLGDQAASPGLREPRRLLCQSTQGWSESRPSAR